MAGGDRGWEVKKRAPVEVRMLAIETSGDTCSVAVAEDGEVVAQLEFQHRFHLSERLMSHIQTLLAAADTSLEQIDAFAVGTGPGSFTGGRIGVMTAKTLAAATGKPLYGVNALEAMAH